MNGLNQIFENQFPCVLLLSGLKSMKCLQKGLKAANHVFDCPIGITHYTEYIHYEEIKSSCHGLLSA